jgi:UDP-N-acetylglucosamine 2-epimerase (non-hydrolysing)
MKKKVLLVFGTRPEAIKMAPLVKILEKDSRFEVVVCVTAQHREMLDMVLELFSIVPDYDLNIMKQGQDLFDITSSVLLGIRKVIRDCSPDIMLVHGDTTTTMTASLAAFYEDVKVGHVEAGLRTGNKRSPWPEEMNRRITDVLADYYFAPTALNRENLLKENVAADAIYVTGNTVIDALHLALERDCPLNECGLEGVDLSKKIVLLTCHRRENWGEPMDRIFRTVAILKKRHPEIEIVFPIHKNPLVREIAAKHLAGKKGIHLIEPLDYHPFSTLMNKSYLVLTDSGGIQEEAPALGKPVLVLRDTTERPEAVAAGTVRLTGTYCEDILESTEALLDNEKKYQAMAMTRNPYGDGTSSYQIAQILAKNL